MPAIWPSGETASKVHICLLWFLVQGQILHLTFSELLEAVLAVLLRHWTLSLIMSLHLLLHAAMILQLFQTRQMLEAETYPGMLT